MEGRPGHRSEGTVPPCRAAPAPCMREAEPGRLGSLKPTADQRAEHGQIPSSRHLALNTLFAERPTRGETLLLLNDPVRTQVPAPSQSHREWLDNVAEHHRPKEVVRDLSRAGQPGQVWLPESPNPSAEDSQLPCLEAWLDALGESQCWDENQREGTAGHLKRTHHCRWHHQSVIPHHPFQLSSTVRLLHPSPVGRCSPETMVLRDFGRFITALG